MKMNKFQNKYRIGSARLPNWDYRSNADYFVTICTKNRKCFFGEITDSQKDNPMTLSKIGQIAQDLWEGIPNHFPDIKLGEFVVMPNHVHGIVEIKKSKGDLGDVDDRDVACNVSTQKNQMQDISPKKGALSTIIRSYKSAVTKNARLTNPHFAWQSRFYDHVIRNPSAFNKISNYIINNPKNWDTDKFYS